MSETRFDIHLGHLYLEADRRNQGLGTRFLQWMTDRARALYERLGFVAAGTSAGKIRMQQRAS